MNPGLDSLDAMVRQLWPRYKASVQPMWDTRLYQYTTEELRGVLWRHRSDYPDDTKPVWRTIYTMLSGGNADPGTGKSDLQSLLDFMRRQIAATPEAVKHKPINEWTDADCFDRFVEANAGLRDPAGKLLPDVDGRRARLAANERAWMANRYIRDLEERGERVPEWLLR